MSSVNMNCASATLYVGDLHPDVTESMLLETFSPVGPVQSIRVCRDKRTNKSLGYAYVNFCNPQDAEKALHTENYKLIKGRPLRIMRPQKDATLRILGKGNIFIKNLDTAIDTKALCDTFSVFGNILSCKVAIDRNSKSKGYGFVHFEKEETANNAIAKINGMIFNGKKVIVEKFLPRGEREKPLCTMNLYIKNLNEDVDDDKLNIMFQKYGAIASAKVVVTDGGKSKGFGFVCFEDSESAKKAIEELDGKDVNGRKLYVGPEQKKEERQADLRQKFEELKVQFRKESKGINLYIKDLDEGIDDECLINAFSPFGTITSAKVMTECDKRSRGFGFVCFSSQDEAAEALKEMHGRVLISRPIYVTYAESKKNRRPYFAFQWMSRM